MVFMHVECVVGRGQALSTGSRDLHPRKSDSPSNVDFLLHTHTK